MTSVAKWPAFPLVGLLMAGLAAVALGHSIRVFATVQNGVIEGEVYMTGGARPQRAPVLLLNPSGEKLGETATDSEGRFAFKPASAVDHRIVVDTGDGHRADYVIKASEIGGVAEAGLSVTVTTLSPAASAGTIASPPAGIPSDYDLRVVAAVQREVRPLREQIDRLENKVLLRDILGGIGYIFGLAGLAFFLKGRKAR